MANPVLKLDSVTKRFGSREAVQGISFDVRPGEVVGLIGPNGSGKSTTLKMIAGLYRPSSGRVFVQGYDVAEAPTKSKRHIGYVPDEPTAYERLTGREFMEFVGELFGMDRKVRNDRIDELLASFGVASLAEGMFQDMSRGTKQKITLLAALLHDPSLMLIDEPMVGLDPASARVAKRLIREFADEGGAVLLSTHTLDVAEDICDRYIVLVNGNVLTAGTKQELVAGTGRKTGSLEDAFIALTGEL
jgi:ABC-2 type transport system ATP-binding protein